MSEQPLDLKAVAAAMEPLAKFASYTPIMAGRGETTRPREPKDGERFDFGHNITWGMLRALATAHASLTAHLEGSGEPSEGEVAAALQAVAKAGFASAWPGRVEELVRVALRAAATVRSRG